MSWRETASTTATMTTTAAAAAGVVSTTPTPAASSATTTSITRCYWDDGACGCDDALGSRGVSAVANVGAGRVKAFM